MTPRAEIRDGILAMLPIAVAAIPFGMLFGAEAMRQGLTLAEAVFMSLTVFAGGAQFMAMGLWAEPAPWLALALATFVVNLRHALMAASLSGRMAGFAPGIKALAAFFMADETWALAERRALSAPLTRGYYFGVALTLYVLWAISTAAGALVGGLIARPEVWGIDFAFPAIFLLLITGFARSWRALPVIAAAGGAALVAQAMVPGAWFILIGGIAGIAAAALMPAVRT